MRPPERRQRVTVPRADLIVQPSPSEVTAFAPAARGEIVTEMATTAADRAIGRRRRYEVMVGGWRFEVTVESAERAELLDKAARAAAAHAATAEMTLRAQIPGRVARMWVAPGDAVEHGQRLLAIEAMKMENEIRAPRAGVVARMSVELGARVERDDELVTIA